MLVFLSYFPDDSNIRDGMSQRIFHIDNFFIEDNRIYVNADIKKHLKKEVIINGNRTIINCNPIIHFFDIINILRKAKSIYIHSVYNVLYLFFHILLIKNNYIIDLHGVVPEENKLANNNFKYHLYNLCEQMIFKKISVAICVTNAMVLHYKAKFSSSNIKYVVFSILPETTSKIKIQKDIKNNEINVVYSGNTQKWQNIDLMINFIKSNMYNNINYIILTNELSKMNELIEKQIPDLKSKRIQVLSVSPEDLYKYYEIAHYGFILRNDIAVNRVACPTKLIEYMSYGIIPIILSPKIGDFESYGFEYVNSETNLKNLKAKKSERNCEIIHLIKSTNENTDIRKITLTEH